MPTKEVLDKKKLDKMIRFLRKGEPAKEAAVEYDLDSAVAISELINADIRSFKRVGYSSFWQLLKLLWRQNRIAKKYDMEIQFNIKLPTKWL